MPWSLEARWQVLLREHHTLLAEDAEVCTLTTGRGVQYLNAALNETIRALKAEAGLPLRDESFVLPWQRGDWRPPRIG